jgi:dienelactone hydrolase
VWPLHHAKAGWGRAWNTLNAAYDPAATLAAVKMPVLWFLGQLDHNLPSGETARLLEQARMRSGNKDFSVVHIVRTGHAFLESDTGNNGEFMLKSHMAAGYWNAMETWLQARAYSPP